MNKKHKEIWKSALPYLKKGIMKDFVVHTRGVVKAMEILLKSEKGDADLLIPAAILHDVGWAKVSKKLQKSNDKKERFLAYKQHIRLARENVRDILLKFDYNKGKIEKIIEIIVAHISKDPKDGNKRLLIDADNLSDVFKEQFHSDAKSYGKSLSEMNYSRKNNSFYTKTAQSIFENELKKRKEEINGGK